ncbi:MAG: DUF805 domain-containing protein [Rhizobiaceae bacterium]|nr:DUF805 domain-containing protein [Rhizobiaceae bacterium]
MRGEILHYDVSQGIGFISAEDGTRYMFSRNDLMQSQRITKGMKVDFQPEGQNARDVRLANQVAAATAQDNRQTTATRAPSLSHRAPSVPVAGAKQPWGAASEEGSVQAAGAPDMGVWSYFRYCSTKAYARFRGRARRKEYWSFVLLWILAILAACIVGLAADAAIGNLDYGPPVITLVLFAITALVLFIPGIAVTVRRFHDVGLSGWLYLLFFVLSFIYIGGIVILVITLLPSQKHDNKWGAVPDGIRM